MDGEVVDAVALVGEPAGAGRHGGEEKISMQLVAAGAISEAILEDQILPLFQQSRGTTPIEGVLEDDEDLSTCTHGSSVVGEEGGAQIRHRARRALQGFSQEGAMTSLG